MSAAAAVSVVFSIAVSQILVGMALTLLLITRQKIEMPPLWRPLVAYVGWTLVALLAASAPDRGLPQIKKFFIFLILLVGYTLIRRTVDSEWISRALVAAASLAAVVSIAEFAHSYVKLRNEGADFYTAYSLSRITGFMGHWMTFSGQEMLILMVLLAWLLGRTISPGMRVAGWAALGLIVAALMLGFTRGVWLGALCGSAYLLWHGRRRWLVALPVMALLFYAVSPDWMKLRLRSVVDQNDNSVLARVTMWRVGTAMVQAHPFVGVGPDGVKDNFQRYRPDAYVPDAFYGHLHNNLLQIAAERGLPGLAAFVWLLAAAMIHMFRRARAADDHGWPGAYLARGALAATIAFVVAGFSEYNFGDSEVAMLWLFLLVNGYSVGRDLPPAPGPLVEEAEPEAVAVA